MSARPPRTPRPLREAAAEVALALSKAGHVAYFAGGCVRDRLMGREPEDYDVATSATPDEIRRVFPSARGVGEAFGVMLVRNGGHAFEVATFREDFEYRDGRRPEGVRFSDAFNDAQRRDFTVNGLFEDPATGEIVDHVEGRRDLEARIVRAIGDPHERIREDRLRMLRAARFTARLGFALDPATARAIESHARELASVSAERVGDEMRRMLAHPARGVAARLVETLGLDAAAFGGCAAPHSFARLDALPAAARPSEALAAWWIDRRSASPDDAPRPGAEECAAAISELRRRLVLSNDETEELAAILSTRDALLDAESRRAEGEPPSAVATRSWRARLFARRGFDAALRVLQGERPEAAARWRDLADLELASRRLPRPFLDGAALIAAGMRPGPAFKSLLEEALDRQIDGRIASRDEAIAWASGRASGDGGAPSISGA